MTALHHSLDVPGFIAALNSAQSNELFREKNYSRHPQLIELHTLRLVAADKVAGTYIRDERMLREGLIRFEKFMNDTSLIEGSAKQLEAAAVRDGKEADSLVILQRKSPAFTIARKVFPIVASMFQPSLEGEVASHFAHNTYLQHLLNRPDDDDEQKVFHSDTFFHCVKFWYFPKAVSAADGAFWYVPESPILTDELIEWHRERADDLRNGVAEAWRGAGHREGSFRISAEELGTLHLEAIPVEVEADTLVLANVFGFHRRGDTASPTHRLAIHGSIRIDNPFGHGALNG